MAGKWEQLGAICEKLYLDNGMTLDEIHALLNGQVSRKTLGEWCTNQHWVTRKKSRTTSATRIVEQIDRSIAAYLDENEVLDPATADAVTKLSKTKSQYLPHSTEQKAKMAIEVISWLYPFMARRYPDRREQIREDYNAFVSELAGAEVAD